MVDDAILLPEMFLYIFLPQIFVLQNPQVQVMDDSEHLSKQAVKN